MSQDDMSSFSNESLIKSHDNLSICIEKELENNEMKIGFMKEFIDSKSNQLVDLQNFLIKEFQDIQNFKQKHVKIQDLIEGQIIPVLLDLKNDLKNIGNYIYKIPLCFTEINKQILEKFYNFITQKNEQIFQLKETIKKLQNKNQSEFFPLSNTTNTLTEKYKLSSSKNSFQKFQNIILDHQQSKKFQLQKFRGSKTKSIQKSSNSQQKMLNFKNIEQIEKSEFFADDSLEKQSRQRINSREILDRKCQLYRLQHNQFNKNQDKFLPSLSITPQKSQKSISIQKNSRQSFLKNYRRNISQTSLTQSKYSQAKLQREQFSPLRYSQLSSINLKDIPGHNRSSSTYIDKEQVEQMKRTECIKPNYQKFNLQRNKSKNNLQESIKEKQNNFQKSPIKDRKKYIKQKIQRIKQRQRQKQKQKEKQKQRQRQRQKSIKKMYY